MVASVALVGLVVGPVAADPPDGNLPSGELGVDIFADADHEQPVVGTTASNRLHYMVYDTTYSGSYGGGGMQLSLGPVADNPQVFEPGSLQFHPVDPREEPLFTTSTDVPVKSPYYPPPPEDYWSTDASTATRGFSWSWASKSNPDLQPSGFIREDTFPSPTPGSPTKSLFPVPNPGNPRACQPPSTVWDRVKVTSDVTSEYSSVPGLKVQVLDANGVNIHRAYASDSIESTTGSFDINTSISSDAQDFSGQPVDTTRIQVVVDSSEADPELWDSPETTPRIVITNKVPLQDVTCFTTTNSAVSCDAPDSGIAQVTAHLYGNNGATSTPEVQVANVACVPAATITKSSNKDGKKVKPGDVIKYRVTATVTSGVPARIVFADVLHALADDVKFNNDAKLSGPGTITKKKTPSKHLLVDSFGGPAGGLVQPGESLELTYSGTVRSDSANGDRQLVNKGISSQALCDPSDCSFFVPCSDGSTDCPPPALTNCSLFSDDERCWTVSSRGATLPPEDVTDIDVCFVNPADPLCTAEPDTGKPHVEPISDNGKKAKKTAKAKNAKDCKKNKRKKNRARFQVTTVPDADVSATIRKCVVDGKKYRPKKACGTVTVDRANRNGNATITFIPAVAPAKVTIGVKATAPGDDTSTTTRTTVKVKGHSGFCSVPANG